MNQPVPEPINVSELPELACAVIERARFPHLATIDGDQPRLRPVSPVKTDGFTIYIANLRSYHKTIEIAANPKVELAYLDEQHDQVRITGIGGSAAGHLGQQPAAATVPGLDRQPQLIVYRVVPNRVRFMREWALEYHDVPLD